jgi:hypothetical protein
MCSEAFWRWPKAVLFGKPLERQVYDAGKTEATVIREGIEPRLPLG